MKPLKISDPTSILTLQQEIRRSEESRYDHRLHGVLLVAQGMTCPDVARQGEPRWSDGVKNPASASAQAAPSEMPLTTSVA
jgi:hypothetical protein